MSAKMATLGFLKVKVMTSSFHHGSPVLNWVKGDPAKSC